MNFINTIDDLFSMLDRYTEGVDWNTFYIKRDKPAPFLKYNKLPDKCVVDFIREHNVKNANLVVEKGATQFILLKMMLIQKHMIYQKLQ